MRRAASVAVVLAVAALLGWRPALAPAADRPESADVAVVGGGLTGLTLVARARLA